jgi:hypothetical protein
VDDGIIEKEIAEDRGTATMIAFDPPTADAIAAERMIGT